MWVYWIWLLCLSVCIYHLCSMLTQNVAAYRSQLRGQRDETLLCLWAVASQLRWRHQHSPCDSLTKPGGAPPRSSSIDLPQRFDWRVALKMQSASWTSLLSRHSPVCSGVTPSPHWMHHLLGVSLPPGWLSGTHLRHPAQVVRKCTNGFISVSLSLCLHTCTRAPAPLSISPPPSSTCLGPHLHPPSKIQSR